MSASFWEDRPARPLKRKMIPRGGRMVPNPRFNPCPRPVTRPLRVSVRADLLDQAADLIADQDPALSRLFKRMAKDHAE